MGSEMCIRDRDGTAESIVGFFWFVALSYFIFCAVLRAKGEGAYQ